MPKWLDKANAKIVDYIGTLHLTRSIIYQPNEISISPLVTNESIRFYFVGDVFLNQTSYQTVNYPLTNLTFEQLPNITATMNETAYPYNDIELLVSPTLVRLVLYNFIESVGYY